MSKIGNYRVGLQETAEYKEGWDDFGNGILRSEFWERGQPLESWFMGWDDAEREFKASGRCDERD
jgi:hypothetical protein